MLLLCTTQGPLSTKMDRAKLNEGLISVRVVAIQDGRPFVRYIPALIQIVDVSGAPTKAFQCLRAQDVLVVSGYLALTSNEGDVRELSERVKQKYGSESRVERIILSKVEFSVLVEGQTVARAGPSPRPSDPLSIQFDLPILQTTHKALLVERCSWSESELLSGTVSVPWAALTAALRAKADASKAVTGLQIRATVSSSLDNGAIVVRATELNPSPKIADDLRIRAAEAVISQIKNWLLIAEPSGLSNQSSDRFSLRAEMPAIVPDQIDISITRTVTKEASVSREINLCD